jgi:hypothetical protein
MQPRIVLSALAGLALAASASFAQATPPSPPSAGPMMHMKHFDKAEMEKHMAQMCQDRYAKAVGKLAELETKLDLTTKQKPLFERWKDTILSTTKARVADCANFKMPEGEPSIVDQAKMHLKRLQAQLDILKAQMPALEALNTSLDADQQKVLKHTAMKLAVEREMGRNFIFKHMMMRSMMHHHDGDDDNMPAPPPPPAN